MKKETIFNKETGEYVSTRHFGNLSISGSSKESAKDADKALITAEVSTGFYFYVAGYYIVYCLLMLIGVTGGVINHLKKKKK